MTLEKKKLYFLWISFFTGIFFFAVLHKFYPVFFQNIFNAAMLPASFFMVLVVVSAKISLAKARKKGLFELNGSDIRFILNKDYLKTLSNIEKIFVALIFLSNALVSLVLSFAVVTAVF